MSNMHDREANIIRLSEVSSTNKYAKELLGRKKPVEGTVIQAAYQTAGKGHDNKSWESHAGENLLMSMILYPDFLDISKQFSLSMIVALGIIDFLKEFIPDQELYIKWPNDVYVGNKKISGILINNEIMGEHFEHVIVGIGINVNQTKFSKDIPNPISLKMIRNDVFEPDALCAVLGKKLLHRLDQLKVDSEGISEDYHTFLLGRGEWRHFIFQNKKIRAKIGGVNEYGRLMLETNARSIDCDLKEIEFIFQSG